MDDRGRPADRGPGVHGPRLGDHDADGDGDAAGDLPAGRARPGRSRSWRPRWASACRSGRSWAAGCSTTSGGARSSWSTCRWRVIGMVPPRCFSPSRATRAPRPADLLGGVLSTVGPGGGRVRRHRGAPPRLGRRRVAGRAGRRAGAAGRLRALGAPLRVPDDRPRPVPPPAVPVGHDGRHGRRRSRCSGCCSRCRSTSRSVQGYDAFGTGVRLLPMMGGLIVGAGRADRIVARIGTDDPVAAGLLVDRRRPGCSAPPPRSDDGYGLAAAWLARRASASAWRWRPRWTPCSVSCPPDAGRLGHRADDDPAPGRRGARHRRCSAACWPTAYTGRWTLAALPAARPHAARESVAGAVAVAAPAGRRRRWPRSAHAPTCTAMDAGAAGLRGRSRCRRGAGWRSPRPARARSDATPAERPAAGCGRIGDMSLARTA